MTEPSNTTTPATNQLIPISKAFIGGENVNSVDARELHAFLEVKKQFTDWIKPKIKDYGFVVNSDFYPSKCIADNAREMETYIISIDMAKELSMISKTDKGKEARKYFIAMEKEAKRIKAPAQIPETIQCQLMGAEILSRMLNYSEASKIDIVSKVYDINNIDGSFLPVYAPDVKVVFSATELLKKNKCELKVRAFNNLMVSRGLVEIKSRPSTKGRTKYFKALVGNGLKYGQNDVSPQNKLETQPHYFENSFMDLYALVTGN